MNLTHQAILNVFDNEDGKKLIELLKAQLWLEPMGNINNSNEFIFKEGKRAMLQDIEFILNTYKNQEI
jgi:hypothetical protein